MLRFTYFACLVIYRFYHLYVGNHSRLDTCSLTFVSHTSIINFPNTFHSEPPCISRINSFGPLIVYDFVWLLFAASDNFVKNLVYVDRFVNLTPFAGRCATVKFWQLCGAPFLLLMIRVCRKFPGRGATV